MKEDKRCQMTKCHSILTYYASRICHRYNRLLQVIQAGIHFLLKGGETMEKHSKMKVYIYLNIWGANKLYLQDPGHTFHSPA